MSTVTTYDKNNNYSHLKSIDKPFDSNEKMQGFTQYSTLYSADNKPYQHSLYGKGVTEPTFVGIPFRSTCYENLCILPQRIPSESNETKSIFKEFDRGMLIYKKKRNMEDF